jgi:3',5'-cyclic AMP phosphodiesterase CpdA
MERRDFLALTAVGGGVVFASALAGCAAPRQTQTARQRDFYFVQLSDSHWGYAGPANPDAAVTLGKAVATVNALQTPPDFVFFTGDLTHTTDDPVERRRRLGEFRSIVAELKVKSVRFIPGEHDAALDHGAAYREFFGETYYSFDHGGVHFIALDNVSDPGARVDQDQMTWLKADLATLDASAPVVVLTHRPLFDLAPKWDWATRNGPEVVDLLLRHANVTVFYGHIHQENHHLTGHIAHHSAKSLIFPLPTPGSQEKRAPLPWDPVHPYLGLGFREVEVTGRGMGIQIAEFPVLRS